MAYLILNGTTIPISADDVQLTRVRIGSLSRAYSGAMRSTVRALKVEMKCKTTLIDNTLVAALRGICNMGERVAVTGTFGGYYAVITIGDEQVKYTAGGVRYVVPLFLQEV